MRPDLLRDLAYLWHLEAGQADRRRDYDEGDRLDIDCDDEEDAIEAFEAAVCRRTSLASVSDVAALRARLDGAAS